MTADIILRWAKYKIKHPQKRRAAKSRQPVLDVSGHPYYSSSSWGDDAF